MTQRSSIHSLGGSTWHRWYFCTSLHCFERTLTFTDHCFEGNTIFQASFTRPRLHNRCGSNLSCLNGCLQIDVLSSSEQCAISDCINVLRERCVSNWFAKPATTDICRSGRFTDLLEHLLNIPSWHNSVQSALRVVCFECGQATLASRLNGDKFPTHLPLPQTLYL